MYKPPGIGVADVRQRFQEPAQQFLQILGLQLDAEQLVKRLCFRFANLIIGVVERQDHAEVQLFANPLKIGVLVRNQRLECRRQDRIVLFQSFQNGAGRKIHLGQPPAVVFHLLDEFQRRMTARQHARGRARGDGGKGRTLLGLKSQRAQALDELTLDFFGVRLQQYGEPLQMHAELIA